MISAKESPGWRWRPVKVSMCGVAIRPAIHLRQRSAITGLRLFQGSAVVPIFQIGEHGAGLNRIAFMHVDFLDHAFDLRLNLRAA